MPHDFLCGPYCLWYVARLLDRDVPLDSAIRRTRCDVLKGTSVEDMVRGLVGLGLDVDLAQTTIERLAHEERVAVLLLDGNTHFVLLDAVHSDAVWVLDGLTRRRIDRVSFAQRWQGTALLAGPRARRGWALALMACGACLLLVGASVGLRRTAGGWWRRCR